MELLRKEVLCEVLKDWSYWEKLPPAMVPRSVELPAELISDIVVIIQGVRRCGKSTLMAQFIGRFALNKECCCFVNFEDPRLAESLSFEILDQIVALFRSLVGKDCRAYFFLDEIQHVTLWEKWLRTQIDRPKQNYFVISGSNASLLSGELGSALTGRHLTVELFPFDLQEFAVATNLAGIEPFMRLGGFPKVVQTSNNFLPLVREYFVDIIERDIRNRVGARSSRQLITLAKMIFESCGSEVSLRRLASATSSTADTVSHYIDAFAQAYLIFSVPFFAYSERQQSTRNKKYYPIDTGMRQAVITRSGNDYGKNFECLVYLALRRRSKEIFYWRGQGEVDFVVQDNNGVTPYQVTWQNPKHRHEEALQEFFHRFPQSHEAVIVTPQNFSEIFKNTVEY